MLLVLLQPSPASYATCRGTSVVPRVLALTHRHLHKSPCVRQPFAEISGSIAFSPLWFLSRKLCPIFMCQFKGSLHLDPSSWQPDAHDSHSHTLGGRECLAKLDQLCIRSTAGRASVSAFDANSSGARLPSKGQKSQCRKTRLPVKKTWPPSRGFFLHFRGPRALNDSFRKADFSDGMRRPVSDGMRYAPNDRRARGDPRTQRTHNEKRNGPSVQCDPRQPRGPGNRCAFSVGQPAAHPIGTRSDRRACAKRAADR